MVNLCRLYEVRVYVPVNGNGKLQLQKTIAPKKLARRFWLDFAVSENRRKAFVGVPPDKKMRDAKRRSIAESKAALVKHRRMEAVLDELLYTRGAR